MATSTLGSGTLVLAGTTSGTTTVTATAVAGTTTLTLPAATDTLVGKATTDTLTNKTLTGAVMNGTVGATTPSTGAFTTVSATSFLGALGNASGAGQNVTLKAGFGTAAVAGNLYLGMGRGNSAGTTGNIFFGPSGADANGLTDTYMTLDASGNLLVKKTAADSSTVGGLITAAGEGVFVTSGVEPLTLNRNTNDGTLVSLRQDNTQEGTISVSGTTVSYNGGHLSRWAQTTAPKDDSLVKGTVLSNLDEMNVYTKDGQPVANEQLNKVKVSDAEGDANVAGVFVNWSYDEDHNVDEINMAMTGDMIIRIAQGTTVQRGDLLMSAGDGTAKPQGDDIVRSKTVAKVTSNHVTCTYEDGSYCVPCVLMAC